jgi:DNA-directed RNA polymerase subunit RPC12/RpoP
MNKKKEKCSKCSTEFELVLTGYSFWEQKKAPSTFECPNCSNKYYIREPEWIQSLTWNGIKISKRYNQEQINTSQLSFNVDLDAKKVHEILKQKGVRFLHHANTVLTSKTFLEYNALLSREQVSSKNLFQTKQDSDDKDNELGINNYLFLDGKDLAEYFSRPNHYGPVLFKMNLDLLLSNEIKTIRISRKNPIYWNSSDGLNDKYHNNLSEFDNEYLTGDKLRDGGTMFMITTTNGILSLEQYLEEISIDNPNLIFTDKTNLITKISDFLKPELTKLGKQLQILNRFSFQYNFMRLTQFEKYRKFFSINRE